MVQVFNDLMGVKDRCSTLKAKGTILSLLFATCATFTACSDETDINNPDNGKPLQIEVTTAGVENSRSIIDGGSLPDGSQLGLAVTAQNGSAYNGKSYNNILYTSSVADGKQVWETTEKVTVSDVTELVYAYYPYNPDVTDVTQIPMETASQTDYMYAIPAEVNNGKNKVNLTMKHAMAAVKLNIVKGDFSSDATLTSIRMRSAGMGASATLNAKTGALSSVAGASTWFTETHDNVTITTDSPASSEFLVIPTGSASATIDMLFTINGEDYTLQTTPSTTLEPGYIYEYTAVLNDSEVTLKSVTVEQWATQNKGSQNGVPYSIYVKAVKADGTLIEVGDADESCIAVALLAGPKPFWIEKYEDANAAWNGNTTLCWVKSYTDLSLTNYRIKGKISNKNWRTWRLGAISDFNGKINTPVIVASSTNNRDMGTVLTNFNNATDGQNQGYSDWYVPAFGQLYLMFSHRGAINTALSKIGGVAFASTAYWSSSEESSNNAWWVNFSHEDNGYYYKDYGYHVRFVRDIE